MTQEQALTILKTGESVFLTGEPGAGKTHTINTYVRYLREHGIEPAITASTGIAATHIHGMTIHSWSGIAIKQSLSKEDLEKMVHNKHLNRRVAKTNVLIIDEVSMLSARTLDMVDQVCRRIRGVAQPFGGMQVVLVGDFFQLPPVRRLGEESEHARFAFDSDVWREFDLTVCYLTEQHRQDDADFLSVLSALRAGEYGDQHRAHLQKRVGTHEKVVHELPRLFSHNANVDTINDRELKKLSGDEREFVMSASGSEKYVEALKRGCLSPEKLVLKIGASVMCTKNNMEAGFINGTLGTVVHFSKENNYPVVKITGGREVLVEPMEWAVEEDGKVKARINQVPLRLAWAMTIHKSQGMTMDSAVIDLTGAFEYGQGYVALSRVRQLAGLYLLGFNERALQVHPEVLARDEDFRGRSRSAQAGLEQGTREQREQLHKDFILACGGKLEKATIKPAQEKGEWLASKRAKNPNAYQPWTDTDDDLLRTMFEADVKISHLVEFFKRNAGAIRSRLRKLGLVE